MRNAALCLLLAISLPTSSAHGTWRSGRRALLRVAPNAIVLSADQPTAPLTLTNDSGREVRVAIEPLVWRTGLGGAHLETSSLLMLSPSYAVIPAHGTRTIHVGAGAPAISKVRSYRLVFREDAYGSDARPGREVPVFVRPTRASAPGPTAPLGF